MTEFSKRVVFTMGGKGGVGKTGVVVALAEWFQANEIPVTLLDLYPLTKGSSSLARALPSGPSNISAKTSTISSSSR